MLLQVFQLFLLDPLTTEKLVYLQKQYLKYTGGLIALTIHATILTTSQILTLPYTQMLFLQVGKLPMEYPRLEVSGIRQNWIILMFWDSKQLRQILYTLLW